MSTPKVPLSDADGIGSGVEGVADLKRVSHHRGHSAHLELRPLIDPSDQVHEMPRVVSLVEQRRVGVLADGMKLVAILDDHLGKPISVLGLDQLFQKLTSTRNDFPSSGLEEVGGLDGDLHAFGAPNGLRFLRRDQN